MAMAEESSVVTCPACGSARVTLDSVGKSTGGEALHATVGKSTGGETLQATCQDCATTWEAPASI
jgi:hypothetical protein